MLNNLRQFKLIQILVVLAMMAFVLRLVDVVSGVSGIVSTAMAESEAKKEKIAQSDKAEHAEPSHEGEEEHATESAGGEEEHTDMDADLPKWRDASDSDMQGEAVKMELVESMVTRRKALDQRDSTLIAREALLRAAEQELDRKYRELTQLKEEIEKLLKAQSEEESERINSLVKVYEAMKAKDAARIFNTLDLDVLVSVISKMSERKMSPVLAAMNAERARTITIMLAQQKKLPQLPQN